MHNFKNKRGILVLVGGGNGKPKHALKMAQKMFNYLNAKFDLEKDYIYSLNTDQIPAFKDEKLEDMIDKVLNNF